MLTCAFLLSGCVQAVAEPAVLSVEEYVAGLELLGGTSAGRAFVGCCVHDKHTA